MNRIPTLGAILPWLAPFAATWAALPTAAQLPAGSAGAELATAPGQAIYAAACANCHGLDGRGLPPSLVAFEEELPDFTDCDFAAREPDADWIAVAHEGGPVRGFSEMMPAFRGALTEEQLGRVMEYIRTLCTDTEWPRGELNLPRALLTEKAYPEDEWVVEAGVDLERGGDVVGAYVYEQRFGPRSQVEVVIPYGWRRRSGGEGGGEGPVAEGGSHGIGDVVVAIKHALYHDLGAGTIVSVMGEVILPTGDHGAGLGAPGTGVEAFLSLGRILPADAFLQAQVGAGIPLYDAAAEGFGRLLLGRTWTVGKWGRAWSPMVEVQAKRDLEAGAGTRVDLVPQIQVSLNTRQHVLANLGVLVPVGRKSGERPPLRLLAYVLLDWFDGGLLEGW